MSLARTGGHRRTTRDRLERDCMAGYMSLDGVRTWYDDHGSGDPLALLHPGGAGVDARAFGPNLDALAAHFHVYTPERRGHGLDRPVPRRPQATEPPGRAAAARA